MSDEKDPVWREPITAEVVILHCIRCGKDLACGSGDNVAAAQADALARGKAWLVQTPAGVACPVPCGSPADPDPSKPWTVP